MRLFRAWESFFGLMGYLRRNRRQRKAVLAKRRNLRRRHRLEALEQRVVLNADAVDDTFSVGYGESMLVAAEDLRGNDQFGANPVVAPSFGTTTQGGTIVENYDGTFQYSPAAGFSGTDSFTYSLNDDDGTPDTATVFVHVAAPTNNPPSSPDLYFNVNERSVLSASSGALLSAASDAEGDPLSIVPFSGGWGSDGYLTVNLDGSFTFDPGTSPSGQTSFGFQISDGVNEPIWRTAYITIDEAYDENPSPTSNPPWAGDATFNVTIGYGTGGWSYDLSSYVPVQGTHYGDPDGDVMSVAYTAPGWTTVYPGQQHSYAYTVTDSYGNQAWATVFINIVEEAPPQPSNNAPYTAGVTYASIYEDTTLSLQAGDPEGDALQLVVVTPPQCGSLSIDGNGVVTYTPNGDFYGTDSFAYYVSDGNSNSGTDFVTVYVNGVGDLPSAADDEYSVDEDGVLSAGGNGVLANDSDADGDALYAVLIAGPSNAQSFTLNSDGSFQYVPTADWNGTDGFQYQAVAADGTSSVVNVTIHVAAVNDAPFPYHIGTINVAEDGSAAIDTSVLVGDTTDAEGGPLAFAGFGLPQHGTISGDAENGYFYTPHADYHGPDSVTYFITDGENTGEGTLYFNVLPVNDAPIARADVLTTGVGTALTFGQLSLTANDTDIDGDNLSVGGLYGHPSHGSVAWHSDGSFTYTPDAGFVGLDSFRYDVTDGQLESRATVWIEVGPLVVLQSGVTTLALAEDSSAALRLTRDRVDGQTATHFRLSVTGGTLSRNGQPLTSTTNITAADALAGFTFSPAANFSGPVTLTITPGNIVSGSFTANSTGAKTATIHVAAVNDAPTISGPAALQVVDASATLLFNTGSGRVITVADVEPGNKQLSISVNHGTVAFGSGAASQNLTFTGDVATVNQQLKTLRYTAPSSWAGPVQLTVTINDTDTTGGGALSASKTVDIRVRPTITVVGGSIGEGDAAGHLAFTIALSAPTDQAVSVNYATSHGSATAGDYESASGTLVFAPNETTKIVYVAVTSDVIAEYAETVYLSLSSAVNAVVTTNSAAGTITDDDPDPVVFVEATEVAEHVGMAVVRVRLSGVSEKSVSVNWSVGGGTAVNPNDYGHEYVPAYDLPWSYTMYHMVREWDELIGQHYEVNAYDYTIPHTGYWVHTTFDGEGVEYNHNPPYFVETSVWDPTWGIAYEGSNDETIHVEAFSTTTGPDPAWANGYTVVDDYVHRSESIDTPDPSQYWGAGFTVAYTWDATGSDYFPESWNPVGSLSGTLYFNPGQTEATFEIYVRDDDESEADETIGVDLDSPSNAVLNAGSDGQITIVDNDTPRAPDAANRTFGINEDQMLSIDAAHGVLAGVSDPDGDAFSVTGYSTPQHGTLAMNAAGDFTYTPSPDFNGQDTFTVDITDATGQTTTITVTLNIAPVNDAPSFTIGEALPQAADAGIVVFENWATSLIAGPADESDQQLMFEVVVEDADEQLLFETLPVVELDGTLWFVPSGLAGTALLKIRLRDNGGTDSGGVDVSDWQEFTIEIAAPVGGTGGGSISIGNPAPAVTPSNDTSTFWNWLHSLSMTTSQGTFDVTQGEIVNATWGDVAQLALEVDQRLVGTGKIRVHWDDPFNSGGSTYSETPIATTELSLSHDYGEPTYGFTAADLTRRMRVQYVVGTQVREQTTIALKFNYTPPSIGELSTGEPSVEEGEEFVISGDLTSMPELANRISISAKLDAGDRGIINLTSITRYESSFEIRGMAPADGAYSVLVLVTDGITTVRKTINVQITDKTPIISWPADNGWGVIMSGALENSDYDFAAIAATVADPGLDDSYTVEIQCDEFDGKIVLDHARKAIHGTSVRRVANDGHLSSLTMTVKQGDETIAQRTFQMYVGYKGLTGFYVERSSDWSTVTEDVDEDQDGEIDFSITRYSGHITLYFANDPGEDITVNIADNESGRVTAQSKSAYSHADFPDIRYRYDAEVDGTWITGQSFLVGIGDLGDSDYYWTNPSSYAWFDILNGDGPSLPKKEPLAYSLSARLADNMSGEEVTVDGRVIRDGAVVVIDRYLGQVFKDRVNDIGSYAVEYALVREGTVPAHISSAAAAAQADWQTATSGTLTFTSASSYGFLNLLPKSDALNEYDEWFEIWIKGDTSDGYGNDVILTGDAHPNGQTSTDGWTYVGMISLYDALNDVTFGTNNVDTSSTGLERASVSDGNALVDLFDGRKSWDAPFDAGLPRFYLGYADRTATTFTIPELASMTQLYTPLSPSQNLDALNDLPADTQFVMADYDTKVSGYQTLNADSTQGGSRTLRRFRIGFMDVTVEDPNPTATLGSNAWRLGYVDRLTPSGYDGADYGFLLTRRDGTSAWFKATPETSGTTTVNAAESLDGASQKWTWKQTGLDPARLYQLFAPLTTSGGIVDVTKGVVSPQIFKGTEVLDHSQGVNGITDAFNTTRQSLGWYRADASGTLQLEMIGGTGTPPALEIVDGWNFVTPDGSLATLTTVANVAGSNDAVQFKLTTSTGLVFEFDGQGLMVAEEDALGNRTEYRYESSTPDGRLDRLHEIEEQGGRITTLKYVQGREILSITDPYGRIVTFGGGEVRSQVPSAGGGDQQSVAVVAKVGQRLIRPDATFDVANYSSPQVISFIGQLSNSTVAKLAPSEIPADTTPNQQIGQNEATAQFRAAYRSDIEPHMESAYVNFQFDRFGLTTARAEVPTADRPQSDVWRWVRDAKTGQVQYLFEPAGRGFVEGVSGVETSTGGYDKTSYQYDAAGNLARITYADNTYETWHYDAAKKNGIDSYRDRNGNTTTYVLNADGTVQKKIDVHNKETVYDYTQKQSGHSVDSLPVGLLKTVTEPDGRVTTYSYFDDPAADGDKFGLVKSIEYSDPNAAYGDHSSTTASESFDYDEHGYLSRHVDVNNVVRSYRNDLLGQVLEERLGELAGGILIAKYTYDAAGNRRSMTTPNGAGVATHITGYEYDRFNRLKRVTSPAVAGQHELSTQDYTYTGDGLIATVRDDAGLIVKYDYDQRRQLIKTTKSYDVGLVKTDSETPVSGAIVWETHYDAEGNVLSETNSVGQTVHYTYDSNGRVVRQALPAQGYAQPVYTYKYDGVGNVTEQTSPSPAATDLATATITSLTFYDKLGRVIRVQQPLNHFVAYEYAADGRLKKQIVGLGSVAAGDVLTSGFRSGTDTALATTEFEYDVLDRLVKTTDELDQVVTVGYHIVDGVLVETHADARAHAAAESGEQPADDAVTTITYDAYGRVRQTQGPDPDGPAPDPNGANNNPDHERRAPLVKNEYYADGRLKKQIVTYVGAEENEPDDRVTEYVYDERGRLKQTSFEGRTTDFEYDGADRLVKQKEADGSYVKNVYNTWGLVTRTERYSGTAETPANALLTATDYRYDTEGRLRTQNVDERTKTVVQYDVNGRRTSQQEFYLAGGMAGGKQNFWYNAAGMSTANIHELSKTESKYDELGRLLTTGEVGDSTRTTETIYDDAARTKTVVDPLKNATRFTFDELGRVVSEQLGTYANNTFTPLGGGNTRSWQYDENGNVDFTTDREGRAISYAYDALDRRTKETWLADPAGYIAHYAYNDYGDLAKAWDPNSTYVYSYNSSGEVEQMTFDTPLADLKGTADADFTFGYTYQYGRRDEVTITPGSKPLANQKVRYTFDALGRVTAIVDDSAAYTSSNGALAAPKLQGDFNYAPGHVSITRQTENSGLLGTTISDDGREFKLEHYSFGPGFATHHIYGIDRYGRVESYQQNGYYRSFKYDDRHQLTSVTGQGDNKSYDYDTMGNRSDASVAVGNRIRTISVGEVGYEYEYDDEGNRTLTRTFATPRVTDGHENADRVTYGGANFWNWEDVDSAAAVGGTLTYAEDQDEVVEVYLLQGDAQAQPGSKYRVFVTLPTPGEETATADALYEVLIDGQRLPNGQGVWHVDQRSWKNDYNYAGQRWQLLGVIDLPAGATGDNVVLQISNADPSGPGVLVFDAVLTERLAQTTEYKYDHRNRLTDVVERGPQGGVIWQVAYEYDVFDRRIVRDETLGSAAATREFFVYDGDNVALKFSGTTAADLELAQRLWWSGTDQLLAVQDMATEKLVWALNDRQGSVVDLVTFDTDGSFHEYHRLAHRDYTPFGAFTTVYNTAVENVPLISVAYTGRDFDNRTGLYDYRSRQYDPTIGSFTQEDGIGIAADLNRYRYVGNSPLNFNDPSGHVPLPLLYFAYLGLTAMATGGAVGAVSYYAFTEAAGIPRTLEGWAGATAGGVVGGGMMYLAGPANLSPATQAIIGATVAYVDQGIVEFFDDEPGINYKRLYAVTAAGAVFSAGLTWAGRKWGPTLVQQWNSFQQQVGQQASVRSANNIAEAAAVRHATWANDLDVVSDFIQRLGRRALRESGGDWRTSEELFASYLKGVSNRLGRSNSRFGIEMQPAALRGGERVPAFINLYRGNTDSLITDRLGNPRLFAFPDSGRLDAGIFEVTSPANSQGLRPLVAGFDITLNASKVDAATKYRPFFGNIPIYDIRLP